MPNDPMATVFTSADWDALLAQAGKESERKKAKAELEDELGQDPDEVSETLLDEYIDYVVEMGET